MTIRGDINVDWNRSPRIILVDEPSDELTAQDLLDTCRDREDRPENVDDPHLVNATGKENLGGGVRVGITLELQNSIVAFQQRGTSDQTGTATTADANGTTLIDSSAQFETNSIQPGATIVNFDDKSIATVIKVVDENELQHYPLEDGTNNDWGIGDAYKIFNVDQCELAGGNVVAVDDVGGEAAPVMPTAFTQIVRTSSSSATLQELTAIQHASFNGGVAIDLSNSTGRAASGTTFPAGTEQAPCDNIVDTLTIAEARGFTTLYVYGNITLGAGTDFTGYIFVGESMDRTEIDLDPDAIIDNGEFYEATVQGTLDGQCHLKNCRVNNINYISGVVELCILAGTITLGGGAEAYFLDCWAGSLLGNPPVIDMGGSGQTLVMQNFNGYIKWQNKNGASDQANASLNAGWVLLDSTITDGAVNIIGVGHVDDYSTGNTTVNTSYLTSPASVADAVWNHSTGQMLAQIESGRWKIESNQMIFYEDDNNTEIMRFNLYDSGGSPTMENVYDRQRA